MARLGGQRIPTFVTHQVASRLPGFCRVRGISPVSSANCPEIDVGITAVDHMWRSSTMSVIFQAANA